MKWIYKIVGVALLCGVLTACNEARYEPKKIRCNMDGTEVMIEPAYNIYTGDGYIIWYNKEHKQKKHYPSTDCMVAGISEGNPVMRVLDGGKFDFIEPAPKQDNGKDWPK